MSKKNNEFLILSSIIVGLFVLLGVNQIDFSTNEFNAQAFSEKTLVNFDSSTSTHLNFVQVAEAVLPEAEAQGIQYPIITRNSTSEITQIDDHRFIARFGLPPHIPNNDGDYVANLVYEDSNGIELESGTVSYYFDKNSCSMSLFNFGRINQTDIPIIKGDMWVVKVAPNGTDNWTDVPQNDLSCTVSTTINSDSVVINSTKSNSEGTIVELYNYKLYEGIKHDLYWTNNNPSWNNHKFSFSNILLEVPNSFIIERVTDKLQDFFPQNGIINITDTGGMDIGSVAVGDVLRSTTAIPVKEGDQILNATLNVLYNHTSHVGGYGRAILYDQDLNHLATSDETEIPASSSEKTAVYFPFSPAYNVTSSTTSVYVGYFFNDTNPKIVSIMEGSGSVNQDISNSYPTAPDPFTNDSVFNSTQTFWTQLQIYGLSEAVVSDMYSQYAVNQHYLFGDMGTQLDQNGETIQYNATDFKLDDGTVINTGFTLLQRTTQPDPTKATARYEFLDGIDELWSVKFVAQPDFTLDVYVDYANVTETLGIGETMNLDPIFTFNQFSDRITSHAFASTCGAGGATSFESTATGTATLTHSGSSTVCASTYARYDISGIPDQAVPIRLTWQVNVTSGSASGTSPCVASMTPSRVFGSYNEDLIGLSLVDFALAVNQGGGSPSGLHSTAVLANFGIVKGNICSAPAFPYQETRTEVNPASTALIDFEAQLESGKDYVQYIVAPSMRNDGTGVQANGAVISNSNSITWDRFIGSFFEVEFEFFDVPSAPQDPITATFSDTPDKCTVDWNVPADDGGRPVDGYQIERSTGGGFSIIVADTGSPIPTEYEDTTISGGVSNVYRVSAINLEGVGAVSNQTNGCGFPEIASAPFNVQGTNVALGTIAVDWQPPVFDGNTPITGYRVERTSGAIEQPSADWQWREHNSGGTDSSLNWLNKCVSGASDPTCEGGLNGIQLNDRADDGGIATESIGSDWLLFKSGIPAGHVHDQNLAVTWEGFSNIGSVGTHQILVYDGDYDRTSSSDFPNGATRDLKGAGLLQTCFSAASSFAITTTNCVLDTDDSEEGTVTVFVQRLNPDATSGRFSVDTIDIAGYNTWDFNQLNTTTVRQLVNTTGDYGLATAGITTFDPLAQIGFKVMSADTGTSVAEFIDDTVFQNVEYGYRVAAINSEGTSPFSGLGVVTAVGLPPPPLNVDATATGSTTITVDWNAPDVGDTTIQGYQIDRKLGVGGVFSTIEPFTNSQDTTYNDQFLASGETYCYRLKTLTNIGTSTDFSNEACATTFDVPDPVENLTAIAIDGSQINVSWDSPLFDGGSTISGYKIERQKSGDPFQILFEERQPETNRILNDTALEIGTTYTYRISAISGFGTGDPATDSATTDGTPQAPPNFACSPATATSIGLSWDTPLTFSAPTGYQIERKLLGEVSFSIIEADTGTTATTFTDTGLDQTKTYVYRILGHTSEGDTDYSEELTCSPLRAPDFPPENLQGEFNDVVPHQMVIGWDIPDTFGIPITEFRVERDDGAGYNEIATVSGTTFAYIDQAMDNDEDQKYRIITVGTEGESVPSIVIPFDTNQTSHWHYEMTVDDTGANKNTAIINGTTSFTNSTSKIGFAHFFNNTKLDVSNESNYDFIGAFGISTYYQGNSTGTDQVLVAKSDILNSTGFKLYIDSSGQPAFLLTNTTATNEISVRTSVNVTDDTLHFIGVGYNGNGTASGVSINVDGTLESLTTLVDNLSGGTLNNEILTIGATNGFTNNMTGVLDDTRIFGSGTLDDDQLDEIANDKLDTFAPVNATFNLTGSTFANISGEVPTIIMFAGFPSPEVGTVTLKNFTDTVNSFTPTGGTTIDPLTGIFQVPTLFNIMGSLSNYTATVSLTQNPVIDLLSNFDLQSPLFTFSGDFFFQHARNPAFTVLSFNYTQTDVPFDLSCNFKSTLFEEGTTLNFTDVFFIVTLVDVPPLEDVVVACIDPNEPPTDPDAPSFGGANAKLSFVSFGDTTGVGNFLQFTSNYGDFFGVGLPFLFIIILAAAFTGRSAPTGIIIIGVALGIMMAMGILTVDPLMWGVIIVLIILGALGGKKFL
ncbi:MAG: hypothetical protein GTN97_04670 [Nitrosopumilaceae archaeon]|nr:hypothetical protein [Nitrosopumilaceae archaeon]